MKKKIIIIIGTDFREPLLLKLFFRKCGGKGRHDCMKLCVVRRESGPARVPRSTLWTGVDRPQCEEVTSTACPSGRKTTNASPAYTLGQRGYHLMHAPLRLCMARQDRRCMTHSRESRVFQQTEKPIVALSFVYLPGCGELHAFGERASKEAALAMRASFAAQIKDCWQQYSHMELLIGKHGPVKAEDKAIEAPEGKIEPERLCHRWCYLSG